MARDDQRYVPVVTTLPHILPAVSRAEATRAARKLYRHFGGIEHGSLQMQQPARWRSHYRSKRGALPSWVSKTPTSPANHDKGWGALIHDVSHDIFDQRYPQLKPHHGLHSKLEAELAAYVVAKGWLDGKLAPKVKAKPTRGESLRKKLDKAETLLKQWERKAKLARTKIRKYKAKATRLRREWIYATNAPEGSL